MRFDAAFIPVIVRDPRLSPPLPGVDPHAVRIGAASQLTDHDLVVGCAEEDRRRKPRGMRHRPRRLVLLQRRVLPPPVHRRRPRRRRRRLGVATQRLLGVALRRPRALRPPRLLLTRPPGGAPARPPSANHEHESIHMNPHPTHAAAELEARAAFRAVFDHDDIAESGPHRYAATTGDLAGSPADNPGTRTLTALAADRAHPDGAASPPRPPRPDAPPCAPSTCPAQHAVVVLPLGSTPIPDSTLVRPDRDLSTSGRAARTLFSSGSGMPVLRLAADDHERYRTGTPVRPSERP